MKKKLFLEECDTKELEVLTLELLMTSVSAKRVGLANSQVNNGFGGFLS